MEEVQTGIQGVVGGDITSEDTAKIKRFQVPGTNRILTVSISIIKFILERVSFHDLKEIDGILYMSRKNSVMSLGGWNKSAVYDMTDPPSKIRSLKSDLPGRKVSIIRRFEVCVETIRFKGDPFLP